MKKLVLLVFMVSTVMMFVGCAGTGNGSEALLDTAAFSAEDMAGIEASLMADRVLAANVITAGDSSILAAVADSEGTLVYRNRKYRSQNSAKGLGLGRGAGTCTTVVTPDQLTVGTEQCVISRLDSGEIKIIRGNGSEIIIPAADATGEIKTFTVDGREWEVNYASVAGEPLVTLKNTRSGMIISVSELDDGTLTLVRDSSEVFAGRWAETGEVEIEDRQGKKFRYRYGNCQ